jgi:succinate dehydrogenase / fumarate reductase iron-sulfur subunit
MKLTLKILRQENPGAKSTTETYTVEDVDPDMRFLYMLDMLNGRLIKEGIRPIAFDHGCREGICGDCGFMINGVPHGHHSGKTVCQLYMREFEEGDVLLLEPFRSRALPVIQDLLVDTRAVERVVQAGAFVPSFAVEETRPEQSQSLDEKAGPPPFCIECGACVAACPNASAMLFAGAKFATVSGFHPDRSDRSSRVTRIVAHMDTEGFGACSNHGECEAVCPKGISVDLIAGLNAGYISAALRRLGK